jgi:hypothetical protein
VQIDLKEPGEGIGSRELPGQLHHLPAFGLHFSLREVSKFIQTTEDKRTLFIQDVMRVTKFSVYTLKFWSSQKRKAMRNGKTIIHSIFVYVNSLNM